MDRRRAVVAAVVLAIGIAAVAALFGLSSGPTPEPPGGQEPSPTLERADLANRTVGYTHQRATGNRVVEGRARIPDADPWQIAVPGRPRWVVGAPAGDGNATVWALVMASGQVRGDRVGDDGVTSISIRPSRVDPSTPPAMVVDEGGPTLLLGRNGSRFAHPVVGDEAVAWPTEDGAVAVRALDGAGDGPATVDVDALPDARLAVRDGVAAVLVGPTRRYRHGVLGDDVEAAAVALVDLDGPRLLRRIAPPDDLVVEGLQPTLADVGDGDDDWEVVVTASGAGEGARLLALDRDGGVAAEGRHFDTGNRWRHRVGVASVGGDRETVAVETPHIGGTARFHRVEGDRLRVAVSASPSLASHWLGSRNLDAAALLDADGDGARELLAPGGDRRSLVAVGRENASAVEDWRVATNGTVTTNLAAATADGNTTVAIGTERGLRLWRGRP